MCRVKAKSCGRVIWKESVELLPLGVAAILGVVLFQVFVAYIGVKQLMGTRIDLSTIQSIGIKLSLIFGGAVSATVFNREEDRNTRPKRHLCPSILTRSAEERVLYPDRV
jgi:hypothetical protein